MGIDFSICVLQDRWIGIFFHAAVTLFVASLAGPAESPSSDIANPRPTDPAILRGRNGERLANTAASFFPRRAGIAIVERDNQRSIL